MRYFYPLFPYIAALALMFSSQSFAYPTLINGLGQLMLFSGVVCLPIFLTKRMSYVDIGWPLGLVLIGVVSYYTTDGYWLRSAIISLLIAVVGLRMGLGAVNLWRLGLLKKEFPRYQYQRLRWQQEEKNNIGLALQIEGLSQGFANASLLSLPVFIIASNPTDFFSMLELLGLSVMVASFVLESVADMQKVSFMKAMKRSGKKDAVCDAGLWRYSRHPNYFFEWMVWNGLIIASIPSWWLLRGEEQTLTWLLLGVALIAASAMMYRTLVYGTGALPSEYYSLQRRPAYRGYQHRTNRFFPGPPRH